MAKFKKGQKVRILKDSDTSGVPPGTIVTVNEEDNDMPFCTTECGRPTFIFDPDNDEYELITDHQPIIPKVGERYRVLKTLINYEGELCNEIAVGGIKRVTAKSGLNNYVLDNYRCISPEYFTTEYLELVEDDIKEVVTNAFNVSMDITYGTGRVGDIDGNYVGDLANCPVFVTQEPNQTLLTKTKQYMTNLYRRAKLSAAEKVLLKAGYINDDGTPTTKGQEASDFLQFKANEAELVRMAEADLAEEKE